MTIRLATKLRIILHDVTGQQPVYLSSFTVEVAALPDDFVRWLRLAAAGQVGSGKMAFPPPAIGGKKASTEEVKGGGRKRPSPQAKGGSHRSKKA